MTLRNWYMFFRGCNPPLKAAVKALRVSVLGLPTRSHRYWWF